MAHERQRYVVIWRVWLSKKASLTDKKACLHGEALISLSYILKHQNLNAALALYMQVKMRHTNQKQSIL